MQIEPLDTIRAEPVVPAPSRSPGPAVLHHTPATATASTSVPKRAAEGGQAQDAELAGEASGLGTSSSSSGNASGTVPKRYECITYPNGSTYQGHVVDSKRHGHGTLTLYDGTRYVAEWRNDMRNGEGTELCPDGTCFTGHYVDGVRCGHGVMTWPEGSKYSGQFKHGRANGEGHLLRTDASVYRGQFVNDCMSGQGRMRWKDGVEYVGQFVANRREGQGRMQWARGRWRAYEGGWKDGKQHGHGTLVDQNGQEYSGTFSWGKLLRWDDDPRPETPPFTNELLKAPGYWTNQDLGAGFNERLDVPEAFQAQVQRLLDGTFRAVRTRDRSGAVPSRLRLLKCHRVENSEMWARFLKAKAKLSSNRANGIASITELGDGTVGTVRTQEHLDEQVTGHLDTSVNEHYLWHGTTPEGAIGISTDGFKMAFAGSNAGTYFGRGCYFAECASKSDEYARAGDSILAGVYALLLCRVVCGSLFRITTPDQAAIDVALATGKYDSVLGDREASVGTYREFVIYEEDLIYPEYVILYERKFDA